MHYRGHVEKGRIILDEDTQLPEGAKVVVRVESDEQVEEIHPVVIKVTGLIAQDVDYKEACYEGLAKKHA